MDFVAGCIGGTAGCLASHPFDTIKVRMQCQPRGTYKGVLDCLTQTIRYETSRGLYKGLASPLCSVACINAVCFGTYGYLINKCEDQTSIRSNFLAGAGTGVVLSVIGCPIDLLKSKMQMQGITKKPPRLTPWGRPYVHTFSGPLHCMKTIYAREGFVGLNRGMLFTLIRRSPSTGIYFSTNEWLKQLYTSYNSTAEKIPIWYLFIAGGISGCLPWTLFYPLDVVKSRIQCDGVYNLSRKRFTYKYLGYADCIARSVKAEGYGVFYRGLTSTYLRTFPNNGVILTVVALINSAFKDDLSISPRGFDVALTSVGVQGND